MDSLLTKKDVAAFLRRSPASVNRDIKSGRLPCIRIGRSVRIRADVVERISREGYSVASDGTA
jgi:excisionase family DNA binding protein